MGLFGPTHLCKNCGNLVRPQVTSKLNGCFFVVLLLFLIVPGILYLVWAGTQRVYTCPKCKAQNCFVPIDSPEAQRVRATDHVKSYDEIKSEVEAQRDERECPYCAERILKKATVCKHCGREVEPLVALTEAEPLALPQGVAEVATSAARVPGGCERCGTLDVRLKMTSAGSLCRSCIEEMKATGA